MSKYIIDTETWANLFEVQRVGVYGIGNDIVTDEKTVWSRMFSLDKLEELNSDYINEHYGSLQDEAYKRGYAEAERIWRAPSSDNEFYQKGFEDGKKSVSEPDRIEVGDEVIWTTDNITLIATSTYKVGSINWCDGVAKDGKVYSTLIENDRKTGKHYDIQSILEAMRA